MKFVASCEFAEWNYPEKICNMKKVQQDPAAVNNWKCRIESYALNVKAHVHAGLKN